MISVEIWRNAEYSAEYGLPLRVFPAMGVAIDVGKNRFKCLTDSKVIYVSSGLVRLAPKDPRELRLGVFVKRHSQVEVLTRRNDEEAESWYVADVRGFKKGQLLVEYLIDKETEWIKKDIARYVND